MVTRAVIRSRAVVADRLLEVDSHVLKETLRSTIVAALLPMAKGNLARQVVSRSDAATVLRLAERISVLQEAIRLSKAMAQVVKGNKVCQAVPQAPAGRPHRRRYAAAVATSSDTLAVPMYGALTTGASEFRTRMQPWETTCRI